jgi:hypothetical protein
MKRRYVFAGLALLAVFALAAPALGGPSLKKLVKKEVAKQLAGKTGPPGAPGSPGAPGTPGTPGAEGARAYAFVDHFVCNAPPDDNCGVNASSKGVTGVVQKSVGKFCITGPGLSPNVAPAVATADFTNSFPSDNSHYVMTSGNNSGSCTAGQYEVEAFDPDVGGDTGLNLDTSFTFVVP